MTHPAPIELAHAPALMREPHAAAYLGISVTKLRGLQEGPPARRIDGCKVYLRVDLDLWAASLPTDEEVRDSEGKSITDGVFGAKASQGR